MNKFKSFFKNLGQDVAHFFITAWKAILDFFKHPWAHIKKIKDKPAFNSIIASLASIVAGLLIGTLLMLIINPSKAFNPNTGIIMMLTGGFSSASSFFEVLYTAAPLMMTGLAVGFAFKTGLFNIGAAGQYILGGFFALFGAIVLKLPWYVDLLLAALGGALWGAIPGIFKALLNVNEVITGIMFNWLGLFTVNVILANTLTMLAGSYGGANWDRTVNLAVVNPGAIMPTLGMERISPFMNIGIFIAILVSILIYVILNKTTFGYELKACGYNKNASDYAGINSKRNIILSMTIAGALAGLGGGITFLAGTSQMLITKTLPAIGFNGIPVALLGFSNPLGIIFSALFIGYIQIGGNDMQPAFATEFIDVVVAAIIYLSAFSLLFRQLINKYLHERKKKKNAALPPPENPKPATVAKEGEAQ